MAITRAQQAKQMLREGGRLGYRFGGGYQGSDASTGKGGASKGPSSSGGGGSKSSGGGNQGGGGDDRRESYITDYSSQAKVKGGGSKKPTMGGAGDEGYDDFQYTKDNRTKAMEDKFRRDRGLSTLNLLSVGVPPANTPSFLANTALDLFAPFRNFSLRKNIDYFKGLKSRGRLEDYDLTAQGYKDYMSARLAGEIDAAGNPISRFDDDSNDNNFIPVDTTFAQAPSNMDQGTETEEDPFKLALAFRKDGGRIGAMDGGIMDLETGRQMYFLGKLVKKATRAVKKIAKSPIGKAALLYAGGTYLGGLQAFGGAGLGQGTFLSNLKSGQGIANLGGFLKGKLFDSATTKPGTGSKGLFSKILGNPMEAITVASLAAGLTAEQEDEAQLLADNTGIDIEEARNQILNAAKNQDDFRARAFKADGGIMRLGYQEGSKEPVAKKTMPLLDMGGKEMDLREDGGFVPIGRMEKADDVPARLSKNEFVFTADAVRNAGDGNVDKGAEVMYNMMKNLESGGDVSEESQGLSGARRMFQTSQRLEEVL